MNRSIPRLLTLALLGGLTATAFWLATARDGDDVSPPAPSSSTNVAPQAFTTTIRPVEAAPMVLTEAAHFSGAPALVSCGSCHTTTKPNRAIKSAEQLEKFHQGLAFAHGSQSCLNCHNEQDYDTLRLANGEVLEFGSVMNLCGQCHGPQLRDYQRGLHGGMNGYWDLNRGPRVRNNCIHCHDPHAPAFPVVQPVLPPKDRIAVKKEGRH
jgi:formate-dependent nitrite reductase cytochrome c552 subunit